TSSSFTLSLHDALPISFLSKCSLLGEAVVPCVAVCCRSTFLLYCSSSSSCCATRTCYRSTYLPYCARIPSYRSTFSSYCSTSSRSEEHTSELQSRFDLV